MKFSPLAAAVAATLCTAGASALAAPVTFFGEDLTPTSVEIAHPNADAARAAFLASLQGVGTENFDALAPGLAPPIALVFPGAGTATLNGGGSVQAGAQGGDRYPISGNQYFNASSGNFSVAFSSPIAAFGFYGVDIGDYGATLTLALTDTLANVTNLVVPLTTGSSGSTSGAVLYFGFFDTVTQYTNIAFQNSGGGDVFGFDDLTIGSRQQVVPVPEPTALVLVGTALLGLGLQRRRKAKRAEATAT